MQILLVEIESPGKAKELSAMLSSMNFVKSVSLIRKKKAIITALQGHENMKVNIMKNKSKAIAKYL